MSVNSPAATPEFWERFNELPFHKYLGLQLVERSADYSRLELRRTESTPTGIGGSVHGGVLATLVDMTAVAAVFAGLKEGDQPAGTADLQLSYLRQTKGDVVTSEGIVLKRGRQLATIEVKVTDDSGRLCCSGRVLYAFRATDGG